VASSCQVVELSHTEAGANSGLPVLIGFFFGIRTLIPIAMIRLFDADPQIGAIVRFCLELVILGIAALDILRPAVWNKQSLLAIPAIRWSLCYLVFAACSLFWSRTASPVASATYLCGTIADVAIIFLLLRSASAADVTCSLMKGFIWSAVMIAIVVWIMPADQDLRLGDRDFFNANTIANTCAFGIFFAQFLTRRTQQRFLVISFLLCVTLVRSLSKTAIVAFLLSQVLLLIHDRSMSRRAKFALTATACVIILCFWALIEAYYDLYTNSGNQAETLTGRTAIWTYAWTAAAEHPWIGYGFDSIWKVVPVFGTFEARHAENEVLQQLYSFGAAGVLMMIGIYGSLYRSLRSLVPSERLILRCFILYILIRGLTEAEPFDLLLPLWAVVLLSAFTSERHGTPAERSSPDISSSLCSQAGG
jgi:O-antigen ligase